jgi:hypothetical protein
VRLSYLPIYSYWTTWTLFFFYSSVSQTRPVKMSIE